MSGEEEQRPWWFWCFVLGCGLGSRQDHHVRASRESVTTKIPLYEVLPQRDSVPTSSEAPARAMAQTQITAKKQQGEPAARWQNSFY